MTGQPAGAWRVKLFHPSGHLSSPGMTEADAVALAADIAQRVANTRDGAAMLAFRTRHGVDAWVRARDVRTIEPVGPRWDGEDDAEPPRGHRAGQPVPEPTPELPPGSTVDGTTWLQTRSRQAEARPRGVSGR